MLLELVPLNLIDAVHHGNVAGVMSFVLLLARLPLLALLAHPITCQ